MSREESFIADLARYIWSFLLRRVDILGNKLHLSSCGRGTLREFGGIDGVLEWAMHNWELDGL